MSVDDICVQRRDTIGHDDGEFRDNYDANNGNNGLNDLVRDDSSTDSDISAAHKSFKRNIIDDSIQNPSLLLAVQDTSRGEGGARPKRKRKKKWRPRVSLSERKMSWSMLKKGLSSAAKGRSRSPGPVRRRSLGAARRENVPDDPEDRRSYFGEWMGEATGITGDRPRRYNTVTRREAIQSTESDRAVTGN